MNEQPTLDWEKIELKQSLKLTHSGNKISLTELKKKINNAKTSLSKENNAKICTFQTTSYHISCKNVVTVLNM